MDCTSKRQDMSRFVMRDAAGKRSFSITAAGIWGSGRVVCSGRGGVEAFSKMNWAALKRTLARVLGVREEIAESFDGESASEADGGYHLLLDRTNGVTIFCGPVVNVKESSCRDDRGASMGSRPVRCIIRLVARSEGSTTMPVHSRHLM